MSILGTNRQIYQECLAMLYSASRIFEIRIVDKPPFQGVAFLNYSCLPFFHDYITRAIERHMKHIRTLRLIAPLGWQRFFDDWSRRRSRVATVVEDLAKCFSTNGLRLIVHVQLGGQQRQEQMRATCIGQALTRWSAQALWRLEVLRRRGVRVEFVVDGHGKSSFAVQLSSLEFPLLSVCKGLANLEPGSSGASLGLYLSQFLEMSHRAWRLRRSPFELPCELKAVLEFASNHVSCKVLRKHLEDIRLPNGLRERSDGWQSDARVSEGWETNHSLRLILWKSWQDGDMKCIGRIKDALQKSWEGLNQELENKVGNMTKLMVGGVDERQVWLDDRELRGQESGDD